MTSSQQAQGGAEFSAASIINRSFQILKDNSGVFLGLAAISSILSAIFSFVLPTGGTFFNMMLNALFGAAMAYATYQILLNKPVSIGQALNRGFERFSPLIGAAALTTLGIALGMILLIVPGIILACMWAVTIPACALEGTGAVDSIKRSCELTKGYRVQIFAIVFLFFLSMAILLFVAIFIVGLISQSHIVITMVSAVLVIVPQALYGIMIAIIYYDLRTIKEGLSLDSLAQIFE